MKPAIVVIDIQKAFFSISEATKKSLDAAIPCINAAVAFFRSKNLPIVWVQDINEEDGITPGSSGFDMPDSFDSRPEDIYILKKTGSALCGTTLESTLKDMGVDTLIITGFCAEYCVLATSYNARDIGFTPILLRGSLASIEPGNIPFVEKIFDIVSHGAMVKLLETA